MLSQVECLRLTPLRLNHLSHVISQTKEHVLLSVLRLKSNNGSQLETKIQKDKVIKIFMGNVEEKSRL